MIVVADTGPLISLIHIKHLNILEQLYPDYVVAQGVYKELISYKRIDFSGHDLSVVQQHIRIVHAEIQSPLTELGFGRSGVSVIA